MDRKVQNQNEQRAEMTTVEEKKIRPAAIVNFNIFNEVSSMKPWYAKNTLYSRPITLAIVGVLVTIYSREKQR